jgi:hypothetical protein
VLGHQVLHSFPAQAHLKHVFLRVAQCYAVFVLLVHFLDDDEKTTRELAAEEFLGKSSPTWRRRAHGNT